MRTLIKKGYENLYIRRTSEPNEEKSPLVMKKKIETKDRPWNFTKNN